MKELTQTILLAAVIMLATSCVNKQGNEGYTRPKQEVEYIYNDFTNTLHFDKECPYIAVRKDYGTKLVNVYPIGMTDDVEWARVCANCVEEDYLFNSNEDY